MINPSDTLLHGRSKSTIVNDQKFWGGSQRGTLKAAEAEGRGW